MFCPRCGTENNRELRFCRRCGLAMPAVRLALDARMDEALPLMRRGQSALEWSALSLFLGLLNGSINAYLGAWQSAAFSVVVALLVSLSLLVVGKKRLRRANRLLQPAPEQAASALDDASDDPLASLPPATDADAPHAVIPPLNSITEQTTLKLKAGRTKREGRV